MLSSLPLADRAGNGPAVLSRSGEMAVAPRHIGAAGRHPAGAAHSGHLPQAFAASKRDVEVLLRSNLTDRLTLVHAPNIWGTRKLVSPRSLPHRADDAHP